MTIAVRKEKNMVDTFKILNDVWTDVSSNGFPKSMFGKEEDSQLSYLEEIYVRY